MPLFSILGRFFSSSTVGTFWYTLAGLQSKANDNNKVTTLPTVAMFCLLASVEGTLAPLVLRSFHSGCSALIAFSLPKVEQVKNG